MTDVQSLRAARARRAEVRGSLWDVLIDAHHAHRPWLTFHSDAEPRTLSRAEVGAHALRWAHSIVTTSRVERPERIGILLPNGPDFVAAFFAAQALGAAAVPLPWPVLHVDAQRTAEASLPVVRHARLDALVTSAELADASWGVPVVTAPGARDGLLGTLPGADDMPAFVQFTSGSTGRPRGAVISHHAALASARAMQLALRLDERDVGVSWLPFFHDMGLVGVLLTSLLAHFPVHVLRPGDFLLRPRRWLEVASRQRATLTVGPNFAWDLVCRRVSPEGLDLSALRLALDGSEPVHRATLDAVHARFAAAGLAPHTLRPVYGLAEMTLGVAFSTRAVPREDLHVAGRRVPSVGEVLPGIEVRIVDEHGGLCRDGDQGEICVRGPSMMSGYFDDANATAETMRDGWLRTGDLGVLRDEALYVTGREKELVIQRGRKFHPYDIERAVADLVDATPNGVAAVTRIDPSSGHESLVVVVELRRQSARREPLELRGELLRTLGVAVDDVEYLGAGELPRTTSGKVRRKQLARGPANPPQVLLLGAGGFLGLNTARALLAAGITPRCGRRARGNVLGLRELGVPLVVTDFADRRALLESMRDVEVVIHAAAHYPRFSLEPGATLQRGLDELDVVLDSAAKAGVQRLLFVSSTATIARRADGLASTEADAFTSRPWFGAYHALKWELEQRVLAEHRLRVGIINPAACLGPFDWKVGTSSLLLQTARGAPPTHPAGSVSLVDARDVGAVLARLAPALDLPRRLILSAATVDLHQLLVELARRFAVTAPPGALDFEAARAFADAEERHAALSGGRATLPREFVDLVEHTPALDTSLAHALGLRFRTLNDTLDAWETWARRMGFLPAHAPEERA